MKPARDIRSILQEAMALHQQGQTEHAEIMYHEVLATDPREPNAWHLLGVAAWQRGDLDTAETNIRKAIGYQNTAAAYHCNLGGVLKQKGDFAGAIDAYRKAIALTPDYPEAKKGLAESYGNHAYALAEAYQWDEAKAVYRRLLELNPTDTGALNNLAQISHHAGEPTEALVLYDRALDLKPDYAIARFNRGICRLGQNRLADGWQDLAANTAGWVPLMDNRVDLPWLMMSLWDGSNLRGKKILVWGDQGIGDEILYAGMIPELIAQGAQVTLECAERLVPLFTRSFPEITAMARQTPPLPGADFDVHAPGLWLGRSLRSDFDRFLTRRSYLKADTRMTDMLRARYASHGKTKIIGLSWYSKTEGYGAHRRIALRELVAALPRRDVLYIDLQYGDTAAEREAVQREFPDFLLHHDLVINQMVDLDGFAAQVTACDMVITIGNTTAHMAGALGVPAAVLLPIAGLTWYWFKDRAKSPWYPSLNLLRKTPGNGWKPALAGLLKLVEHCDNKPAPTFGDEAVIKELGKDLHERGRQMMGEFKLEEAKAAYRQVLAAEPDNIAALNNLAMVTQHEGHYSAARRLYDQAIRAAPDNLTMRYYRSICHLTEGNLAEGWADFTASEPHWRNMQDSRPNLPWMNCLLWDGSDLRDKKILVWGDQGMGDEIVYISMVPELIARGAQVTIECMDRLVPLVARSFPQTAVLTRRDPPLPKGDFDFHAPGMWLASRLRPTMNSFPPPKPFLKADAEKTARLRQRYQTFGRKRILGLSWYTSSYPWGLKRSIPLPDMLKPLALDDLLIVDLQYADTKDAWAEARKVFPNLAMIHDDEIDQFKDIDSYAAQVAACDFVLTISNTTSHVAGALGIPACVLMADVGLTWYWFTSGEACPWYSSLTLLRPEVPDRLKRAAAMASGAMSS